MRGESPLRCCPAYVDSLRFGFLPRSNLRSLDHFRPVLPYSLWHVLYTRRSMTRSARRAQRHLPKDGAPMSVVPVPRDLVMGVSPCARPQARLVAAVCRAGATGVLDLGGGDRWARQQLELAAAWAPGGFGVRIASGCAVRPDDLPAAVDTVVLGRDAPWCAADLAGTRRVLVEVTGPGEARTAP